MSFRALVVGLVFGLVVAVVPGCSCGAPVCSAANCGTCCDSNGACVIKPANTTNATCGTQGVACQDCTASGATCDATSFQCVGGAGGGAGGGTGSGGGSSGALCQPSLQNCTAGEACMWTTTARAQGQCSLGCNLASTTECGAGKRCVYVAAPQGLARSCVNAGTAAVGQQCGQLGFDDCGPGLLCIGPSLSMQSCARNCYEDTDCDGGSCAIFITNAPAGQVPFVCAAACDLLAQSCPPGQGCYLSSSLRASCFTAGSAVEGTACTTMTACAPGNLCLASQDGGMSCKRLCNPDGGAPACTGPATCSATGAPVGICQ